MRGVDPTRSSKRASAHAAVLTCALALAACGSSSSGSGPRDDAIPASAAEPTLTFHAIKTFRFSWSDVPDADRYKPLENPDGVSGFTQVGSDVPRGTERVDHVVPLYARANARYVLQSCNETGCVDSDAVSVSGTLEEAVGYVKASTVDEDFAPDLDADFAHAVRVPRALSVPLSTADAGVGIGARDRSGGTVTGSPFRE